jgi:hypothetical protein
MLLAPLTITPFSLKAKKVFGPKIKPAAAIFLQQPAILTKYNFYPVHGIRVPEFFQSAQG